MLVLPLVHDLLAETPAEKQEVGARRRCDLCAELTRSQAAELVVSTIRYIVEAGCGGCVRCCALTHCAQGNFTLRGPDGQPTTVRARHSMRLSGPN
jgi:hypothetical protein